MKRARKQCDADIGISSHLLFGVWFSKVNKRGLKDMMGT